MNRRTIYVTRQEWQDRALWFDRVKEARALMHAHPQSIVVIKMKGSGLELWKGVNHCKR